MLLGSASLKSSLERLGRINMAFAAAYPGESNHRQPVHVVYGGAHLFKKDTVAKLGVLARQSLAAYAPDAASFVAAMGLPVPREGGDRFADELYRRVSAKLTHEPVEDLRIDFEDGFGFRSDAEEDLHCERAARELAAAWRAGALPPFVGIRIKSFAEDVKRRSVRTLDLFLSTFLAESGGKLPDPFLITLPKVVSPEQVSVLDELLSMMETKGGLAAGVLRIEVMVETPQLLLGAGGPLIGACVAAGKGRVFSAHLGAYDYTAALGVSAAAQALDHEACDFARHIMKASLAGLPVFLSDGATNILPVGPYRGGAGQGLTPRQEEQNRETVHQAWALMVRHVRRSLQQGFYQGWDLHPAQLPARYGAVYGFFMESLELVAGRLRAFMDKAAQASLRGDIFDDAATGQGLLNYFLRGLSSGAISEAEVEAAGLTLSELKSRSFVHILQARGAMG